MYIWHDVCMRVCHALLKNICVTCLNYTCDLTHPYVWHAMTHSYVWHDSSIRVTCLIHTCDMPHSYMRRDMYVGVPWVAERVQCMHDICVCVTWLIHMCDMTHPYTWHHIYMGVCPESWEDSRRAFLFLRNFHSKEPYILSKEPLWHDIYMGVCHKSWEDSRRVFLFLCSARTCSRSWILSRHEEHFSFWETLTQKSPIFPRQSPMSSHIIFWYMYVMSHIWCAWVAERIPKNFPKSISLFEKSSLKRALYSLTRALLLSYNILSYSDITPATTSCASATASDSPPSPPTSEFVRCTFESCDTYRIII